jgi:hypothetical protein
MFGKILKGLALTTIGLAIGVPFLGMAARDIEVGELE